LDYTFDIGTCAQFTFKDNDPTKLLMFTSRSVIEFDYKALDKQYISVVYTMNNYLNDPPSFGIFSVDQKKCVVTSINDVLLIDLENKLELDIDEKENIKDILNIHADEQYFYVITNKKNGVLGYYVFMINLNDIFGEYLYLIQWTNKLGIAGVDLKVIKDYDDVTKDT
jgi:hypothetical protein